jgi:hypothetical protein
MSSSLGKSRSSIGLAKSSVLVTREKSKSSIDIAESSLSVIRSSLDLRASSLGLHDLSDDQTDAILASILSAVAITGSAVVLFISGGSAAPIVTTIICSVISSAGVSGLFYSIPAGLNGSFTWEKFIQKAAIAAASTLITLGAGYAAGHYTGVLVQQFQNFTLEQMKAISCVAGALAGVAVKEAEYVIVCYVKDDNVEVFGLLLNGVVGAMAGAAGANLAVRHMVHPADINPETGNHYCHDYHEASKAGDMQRELALRAEHAASRAAHNLDINRPDEVIRHEMVMDRLARNIVRNRYNTDYQRAFNAQFDRLMQNGNTLRWLFEGGS